MTSALIRLYPRAWRQRYGQEMTELLSREKLSLRTFTDLVAGAIDAHFNPQVKPAIAAGDSQGASQMTRLFACTPADVSAADQCRSAAWMIGGSIVFSVIGIVTKVQFGPNSLSEGLTYSAFPAALMLSSECTYFKRYSPAARTIMSVGGAVFVVLITWAATAVGNRI